MSTDILYHFASANTRIVRAHVERVRAIKAVSPRATLEKADGVTHMTVEDIDGLHTVDINDGEKGYSPVRGVDYWTEEDQAAIAEDFGNGLGLKAVDGLLCATFEQEDE